MTFFVYQPNFWQRAIAPLISCLPILTVNLVPIPVRADTGILQLQQGDTTTLTLTRGSGTNISFLPTGEIINQVWLDDPSWIALDANGCLVPVFGTNQDCQGSPAQILHLRRIDPLTLPGLPVASATELTVVTQSPTGTQRINIFRITQSDDGGASYHTIEVVPAGEHASRVELIAIRRGRNIAIEQHWLEPGDTLDQRIQNFLDLVNTQPIEAAAATAGVSMELITRLEQLGQDRLRPTLDTPDLSPEAADTNVSPNTGDSEFSDPDMSTEAADPEVSPDTTDTIDEPSSASSDETDEDSPL